MFIDTSGLFPLINRQHPHHAEAVMHFRRARRRLIHSIILYELVALADARKFRRDLVLEAVEDLLLDARFDFVWVDPPLTRRGLDLLHARADKGYSLCDAVSFVLMRDRGISEALTLDHHFEQEGFQRLLTA